MLLPSELSLPRSRDSITAEVDDGGRQSRVPPAPDGEAPSHVDLERLEGRHIGSGAARKHGLTVAVLEEWQDRFLLGAENALRARPKDEGAGPRFCPKPLDE